MGNPADPMKTGRAVTAADRFDREEERQRAPALEGYVRREHGADWLST